MLEVSIEKLKNLFTDFYNLTHFKIVLYDSDRNYLYSYPENMCRFCENVRKNDMLAKKCINCDNKGFDICDETRKPYIYKCHMSVLEAIAPIYSNEINMGYLMFGQILCVNHDDALDKAKEIFGLSQAKDMLSEMTIANDVYINSAMNMMTMCASSLYANEIIHNSPDVFVYQLNEYIMSHLESELSIDHLCKHFYVSRTKLYKISNKNFGMGISDYIRLQRIKKAKKLIRTTDGPISKIAASIGIQDTNYFIRFFKKEGGLTPLQYRKRFKME